jgi:antitoxin YqcF
MDATAENKALYQYVASAFGGSPTVARYWDEADKSYVDILSARDVPTGGVTAYATLGLSDHSIGLQVGEVPLGVEFVIAAATAYECTPNVLSACALNIINSKMACQPGQVYPRVVEMYRPEGDMKHILCVSPFLWTLKTMDFPTKKVAWLQAVPISDAEFALAREKGSDALETVFEEHQIDVYNLDRPSVV